MTVPPFELDVEVILIDGKLVYATNMVSPAGVSPASGFPIATFADARTNAGGQRPSKASRSSMHR